jgi:hypothetical protein
MFFTVGSEKREFAVNNYNVTCSSIHTCSIRIRERQLYVHVEPRNRTVSQHSVQSDLRM